MALKNYKILIVLLALFLFPFKSQSQEIDTTSVKKLLTLEALIGVS